MGIEVIFLLLTATFKNLMRKFILFSVLVLLLNLSSSAQYNFDIGGGVGAANFLGDIGGTSADGAQPFINDIQLTMTRVGINGFARYQFMPWLGVNAGFASCWIEGSDNLSKNPARYTRNLSFRNHINEIYARGEFYFLNTNDVGRTGRYRLDFKSYIYLGAAVFSHNPKTEYNGEWIALQPLQTENKKYSRINGAIPGGFGIYFTLMRNHRFGFETGFRYTFTDYLDDVSGTYPADPAWYTTTDPLAVELSNRSDEVDPDDPLFLQAALPSPGGVRGGAAALDVYMMTLATYSFVFRGKSNFSKPIYKWVLKRKSRAKF